MYLTGRKESKSGSILQRTGTGAGERGGGHLDRDCAGGRTQRRKKMCIRDRGEDGEPSKQPTVVVVKEGEYQVLQAE